MRTLHALAPAKINLFLRIVGRRADGYHFLDSLMIPVSLCDEVWISVENEKRLTENEKSRLVLICDDPSIPDDATNLAYKAAELLLKEAARQVPVTIHLKKKIPAGAGLGGGSSDAATVLKGLNVLLHLGFSTDRLCRLGARLGADIPFFIPCRPARVKGIGDMVTPVPRLPHRWIVLVAPPFGVSTPWAYRRFDELSSPDLPVAFDMEPGVWPSRELLVNDLERAVLPEHPRIAAIKSTLLTFAADGALMSGSGSAVFGIFPEHDTARKAAAAVQEQGHVFLLEPLAEDVAHG